MLIAYADSVYSPDYENGGPQTPPDKFVNRIGTTLAYFGDQGGSDHARKLVRALAENVQSRQHDVTTTAREAESVLHLTLAVICEVERLLEQAAFADKLVTEFGIFRCPVCRSRSLQSEDVVDYDFDDGHAHAYLAGRFVYCEECGWHGESGIPCKYTGLRPRPPRAVTADICFPSQDAR